MASSWGKSWGVSWGNSWGIISSPPVPTVPTGGHSRRHREIDAEWNRQVLAARLAAVNELQAVKLAPSKHTEAIKAALAVWRESEQLNSTVAGLSPVSITQKAIGPDRRQIQSFMDEQLDEEVMLILLSLCV